MKAEEVTLAECPVGLFMFKGLLCMKTEYETVNRVSSCSQSDAYIVSSGEYFWGGAQSAEERQDLMVQPIDLEAGFVIVPRVATEGIVDAILDAEINNCTSQEVWDAAITAAESEG